MTQLNRILASSAFAPVGRLRQFLQYVVEEALAGNSADIKEYTVGLAVFARNEAFDSRLDPVVRVQAGRLRARLAAYYAHEGRNDCVRIDLPVGSYAPVFHMKEPASADKTLTTVTVLPFADYSRSHEHAYFCHGLTTKLIHALKGLHDTKVVASGPISRNASRMKYIETIAKRFGVSTVLDGSLRSSGDHFRITLQVIDTSTNNVTWSKEWDREAEEVIALQDQIAQCFVTKVWERLKSKQ